MKEPGEFPPGWDEARVRSVLQHYEAQNDEQALGEDEAALEPGQHTVMEIPADLVPAVRRLLAARRSP